MRLKWKVSASVMIFLFIAAAGGITHSVMISDMPEKPEDQRQKGFELENPHGNRLLFQPREYIKVVPSKEINAEE